MTDAPEERAANGDGPRTSDPAKTHPVPPLVSDVRRNLTALAATTGITLVVFLVYNALIPVGFSADTVVLTSFVFWINYALTYLILTQWVFTGVDEATLRSWMRQTGGRRRLGPIEAVIAGSGPTINAQWSVLSIAAVGLLLVLPGLLDSFLANALGFGVVVSSWMVTIYAYAVHYARLNSAESTVQFPGKAPGPVFRDYLYLSAQIATTFSSSDVSILTTRGRSVVTGQTLIAFAFSTFIIAMLIAVLFLGN